MIKKMIVLAILLSVAFGIPVWAEETEASATWSRKLKRGALNIVTSPIEIARQIQVTSNERSLLDGWTVGLVKGIGSGLMRLGVGAVELVTFPFDFPREDKEPILEPEYVWEKPGVKYA